MEEIKELWVEKYRPSSLEDYVLNPDLKDYFRSMVKNNALQSMSFAGVQGSGKTTLARILSKEFDAETLFVKCATDGTLDILRTKIQEFCNAMSMDGKIKIVILDEVDSSSSSGANNFQMALRTLIEAAQDDTRFLLTCNFSAKVLPAILSRCPLIPLKFDKRDLLQRVRFILDAEKVEYDRESLKLFIEESFRFYPDCRRIINYLQFCCNTGKLVVKLSQVVDSDKSSFLRELVEKIRSAEDILDVRRFYLQNKDKVSDFISFGSDLYNKVVDDGLVDEDGILKLTDLLYQLNSVVDKEAGLFGMLTAVRKYGKKHGV